MHEDGLLAVPDYLDDDEAATLPCAALTSPTAHREAETAKAHRG